MITFYKSKGCEIDLFLSVSYFFDPNLSKNRKKEFLLSLDLAVVPRIQQLPDPKNCKNWEKGL